jgi:hypothetical protein
MKMIGLLGALFTVACASVPPQEKAKETFNSYCRKGKQIKKFEFTYDVYQTKCIGRTAKEAAAIHEAVFKKAAFDANTIFAKLFNKREQDVYGHKTASNFLVSSRRFFKYLDQTSWCDRGSSEIYFLFYTLDEGQLVAAPPSVLDHLFDNFYWESKVVQPEQDMFDSYVYEVEKRGKIQLMTVLNAKNLESTTSVSAIDNGFRYSTSIDLNPFCKNAIFEEDLMSK